MPTLDMVAAWQLLLGLAIVEMGVIWLLPDLPHPPRMLLVAALILQVGRG